MDATRWARLADDLRAAGFSVRVDALTYPGGVSRSITYLVDGRGLVTISDVYSRADRWLGRQVTAEGADSIIIGRPSRPSTRRSETVAAFRLALASVEG
jgi:hypothetical protein